MKKLVILTSLLSLLALTGCKFAFIAVIKHNAEEVIKVEQK